MPDLGSISLAATFVVAGYISKLSSTSPNPVPAPKIRHKDSLGLYVVLFTTYYSWSILLVTIYHILLTPFFETKTKTETKTEAVFNQICPYPENVNPVFFTWNSSTILSLALIFIGGIIRLSSYGALGRNFTFYLAAPDRLVTSGLFRYMQHPSYTGWVLLTIGVYILHMRWDAAPACLIPAGWLERMNGWGKYVLFAVLLRFVNNLRIRVAEEERMLREVFGKEWEDWNRATSRFIPGIW